jgi:hypothetical protein
MKAGMNQKGQKVDLISVFEGVGKFKAGSIDKIVLNDLEKNDQPISTRPISRFRNVKEVKK